VSPEGWIFVLGFRVIDVGLLVFWLVWFFRLRDEGEEPPDEGGGGGEGGPRKKPPAGPGGGDLPLPDGRVPTGSRRSRDGHRPTRQPHRRRHAPPLPTPLPARVRSPADAPVRIRR
jgi:hypothetical protein